MKKRALKRFSNLPSSSILILAIVFLTLLLPSCVVNLKPYWFTIPEQVTFTGQEFFLRLDSYVVDRDGTVSKFLLLEGPGEIRDRTYYCKFEEEALGALPIKTFRVRIRAVDNFGAISDTIFQVVVIKSSKVSRIPDLRITTGQDIKVDLKQYLKNEEGMSVEQITNVGILEDGIFSFTANSPGTYQCVFLIKRNGLILGFQLLNIFVYEHLLTLNVSEYNSGPSVEGACVLLFDNSGEKIDEAYTTAEGKVCFNKTPKRVVITKPGHATTVIDFAGPVFPIVLDTTLRRCKFSPTGGNISIDYEILNLSDQRMMPNSEGVYEVDYSSSPVIKVKASAYSETFEISHMYLKLGSTPGAEFFTSPRVYVQGSVLTAEVDLASFCGIVPLFIEAYDANDNRYTLVVPLRITRSWGSLGNYYTVEKPGDFAIKSFTIRQDVRYYSTTSGSLPSPLGAPPGTNLYVEVSWRKWEESTQFGKSPKPVAYRIYRSSDGQNFFPIGIVPSSTNLFRDSSPELFPGRRVWYAVSSVYDFGESPRTVLGSVVPLPMVNITGVQPADNATGVSVKPTFSWKFTGLEALRGKVTYYYDLWLYDTIVDRKYYEAYAGDKSIFTTKSETVSVRFEDFVWKRPSGETISELLVGHPYEWGLELIVAEWRDESNSSISISLNCDYNSKFGAYQIPPERYYLFVTGGN
ncbi:hypothetical protein [Fervidobacterium thailandense]|uniref:Carboxypeptidase regulatory-like domain-containing protein n=1 Tax=Fervidobacterium thailandense TaxID=1008305 RepID=A0A1E3G3N1_9BACT|nr:hypothetical protein [Fervidobacterium thailandense]ODN30809.1 hypothetical protein A4H02_02750 [Fervidobacterium thailandense]